MTRESIVLFLAALTIGLFIGWGLGYGVPHERPSILTEEEVRQTVRESCSQNLRVNPETIEFLSLQLIDEQAWLVEYRCLPPPWPNGDDLPSLGPWFIRVMIDAETGGILDEMRIYAQWLYVSVVPDSLSIERTSFHYAVILTNPNDATVTFYLPVFTATLNRIRVPMEIYQWKIWLNMTDPTTLGPHEERTVCDDVIALESALNETCWVEAVAEPDWAVSLVPEGWPAERIVFQPFASLMAPDTSEDVGGPVERYARVSYLERDWIVDEVVKRLRVEGYYRKIVGFGYGKSGFAVYFENEADPRVLAIITQVIDDLPLEVSENVQVETRISLQGVSLYTKSVYPNPHLSAIVFVNASVPLSSLHLFVSGTDQGSSTYTSDMTNYAVLYKATISNHTMPVTAGKTYLITLVATFRDNSTSTASVYVTADGN